MGEKARTRLNTWLASALHFWRRLEGLEFGERSAAPTDDKPVQEETPGEIQEKAPGEKRAAKEKRPAKRRVWGRIALRMASASAILAAIWFAYLVIVVRLDGASTDRSAGNSWSAQLTEVARSVGNLFERRPLVAAGPAQRAVLYEENSATATGHAFTGRAVSRRRSDLAARARHRPSFLSIDAEIPEKRLLMRLSIRRPPDGGDVISHIIEFRFLNSDGSASDVVENVRGVLMKNDELSPGIELVGKVARVTAWRIPHGTVRRQRRSRQKSEIAEGKALAGCSNPHEGQDARHPRNREGFSWSGVG